MNYRWRCVRYLRKGGGDRQVGGGVQDEEKGEVPCGRERGRESSSLFQELADERFMIALLCSQIPKFGSPSDGS